MTKKIKYAIIGDVHLGAKNKYKLYYNEIFNVFEHIVNHLKNQNIPLIIAGDLFDTSEPDPQTIVNCMRILNYDQFDEENIDIQCIIIPGNHDLILPSSYCAADILNQNSRIYIAKHIYKDDGLCIIPYSSKLKEDISEHNGEVLISHFSTNQMSPYAGIFDETDHIFDNYNKIIVGDYHAPYISKDKKVYATCSLFPLNVDEMISFKKRDFKLRYVVIYDDYSIGIETLDYDSKILNFVDNVDDIKDTEKFINILITDNNDDIIKEKNILIKRIGNDDENEDSIYNLDLDIHEDTSSLNKTTLLYMIFDQIETIDETLKSKIIELVEGSKTEEMVLNEIMELVETKGS